MQGQDTPNADNVVSLFTSRKSESPAAEAKMDDAQVGEESFKDVMSKNQKNRERLEKERASANKSVLRSYRIKH